MRHRRDAILDHSLVQHRHPRCWRGNADKSIVGSASIADRDIENARTASADGDLRPAMLDAQITDCHGFAGKGR
jgi:hypothetical protein